MIKTIGHAVANTLHKAGAVNTAKTIRKSIDPGSNGESRSPEWPKVRAAWLEKNPACAICGATSGRINVHHIKDFHNNPSLELDPTNFITLCENNKWLSCHLCCGHLGSFKSININVVKDAAYIKEMLSHKVENEGK